MPIETAFGSLWRSWIRARGYRLLPLMVVLLAGVLRFHQIEVQSFWNDEGNTLRLVERALPDLIAAAGRDIHPPGYYVLLKAWHALMGDSEFALRAFSAFAGMLTTLCVYGAGRALYAPGVGMLAALLTALNTFSIYYGQEARMYALLALWAAAALFAFAEWLNGRRAALPALILINAAGLYTHYAYPFVMLVQGVMFVAWWLTCRDARLLIAYAAANLITLALFAPQIGTAWAQLSQWPRTGRDVPLAEGVVVLVRWLSYGSTFDDLGSVWAYVFPLIAALAALPPDWLSYRSGTPPGWWRRFLPLVWFFLTIGLFLALGLFREANLKFLLPTQIAVALLLGRGLWVLWEAGTPNPLVWREAAPRWVAIVCLLGMAGYFNTAILNVYTDLRFRRADYRSMARIVAADEQPGDAVILNAPNQAEVFTYYYRGKTPIYGLPRGLGGDDSAARAETEAVIGQSRRIFALFWGEAERDPNRIVEKTLAAGAFEAGSGWFGDVRFVRYAALPAPGTPEAVNVRFGPNITLQTAAISAREAAPGEVIGVTLTWVTDRALTTRYRVSVQLLDSDGRLVAQHDAEPGNNMALTTTWQPGQPVTDSHGLLIPSGTAAGAYRLVVAVYGIDDSLRLPVGGGDVAALGRITIR